MASFERGSVLAAMLGDKAHSDEYLARFEAGAGELAKGLGSLHHIAESAETEALLRRIDGQTAAMMDCPRGIPPRHG
jgi:hypothetical protein